MSWSRIKERDMKVIVMQYGKMIPQLSYEQMVEKWKELPLKIPEVTEYQVVCDDGSYDREKLDRLIGDADALIGVVISDGLLTEELWKKHPKLKYIGTLSHGYGAFDQEISRKYGVTITNTIYGNTTIAQYAMALLLDICHSIGVNDDYLKKGYWIDPERPPFVKSYRKQIELCGKTMGIVGLGAIGRQVAQMAHGFGMKIIGYDKYYQPEGEFDYIESVTLEELLQRADVISLNCPLNKETEGLICKETISRMKDGVILINTARGRLIREDDLLEALNSRKIYMAGLDVLCEEPPQMPTGLITSPYCRVTGHIAWMTEESVMRAVDIGIDNYKKYLAGQPVSVINGGK